MGPRVQEEEALGPEGSALYTGIFGVTSGLLGRPLAPQVHQGCLEFCPLRFIPVALFGISVPLNPSQSFTIQCEGDSNS